MLTLALAFRAGGFFAGTTAVLAVVLVLLAVGRVTLARTPFAGWSPALAVAAAALGGLAALTVLSALWSDAPFRALSEFDRTLAYLLVLCLMGSFATAAGGLDRALQALAAAIALIALAALLSRLFPGTFPSDPGKVPSRLAFPLTYWNALAVTCAVGIVLAVHCTAAARASLIRVLAAGALPVLATTAYLTFSRGGMGAALVGVVLYVALARARTLLLVVPAAGIPTAIALAVTYRADGLATGRDVGGEARDVALALLACALAAGALRALTLPAERRLAAVPISRRVRRTVWSGVAAGLLLLVLVTGAPARVDDARRDFLHKRGVAATGDQRDRLLEAGANGRVLHWDVARATARAHPLTGSGAGTFRLEWERERESTMNVADAHSLYFEIVAELGWPGLLLLVVALGTPLVVAARRLRGSERHAHAAFLAASGALLLHAGADWDWEMPAVFAWFFALSGVVCAARVAGDHAAWAPGHGVRVAAGLACLVLAIAPATVVASQRALDRATIAFRAGDCAAAVDGALDSLEALRIRPEPYELLGYCDLRAYRFELGLAAMRAAHARDPHNWVYVYGVAVAEALTTRDPRPSAALALRLNPLDERTQELHAALRRGGPTQRFRAAARARIPFE